MLDATPLSQLLLEQQLIYYGKLVRAPATFPPKQITFSNEALELRHIDKKQRRLHEFDSSQLQDMRCNAVQWKAHCREYCRYPGKTNAKE